MGQLTFVDGQFFYNGDDSPPGWSPVRQDIWQKAGPKSYTTKSLKAAAELQAEADEKCKRVFLRSFNRLLPAPDLPPLDFLDYHQMEGVDWILTRKRSYLAHAPGAGKTLEAIAAACLIDVGHGQTLFIVPPYAVKNWERETQRFASRLINFFDVSTIGRTEDKEKVNWNASFLICPDSMLAKDWVYRRLLKRRFKLIAVDEASRLKEPSSDRSVAFYGGYMKEKRYPGLYQTAGHVVLLDGSPMPNRAMELWAPTIALDPEAIDCMSWDDFGFKYGGATLNERGQWEYKHTSREAELREKLQERFMHVVPEEMLGHPERLRSILFMTEDVRTAEHKTWERRHLQGLADLTEETSQGELATYRAELGIRKIPFIARYVLERLRNTSESLLVFTWHREVALQLTEKLAKYKPGLVIGGTKSADREKIFEAFQRGQRRVIVGNIEAMGRCHNLQRADRAIFGEFSWTDELNKQCEKRASRRGRDSAAAVRCDYICCPGSIDERVLNSVFAKERRVKRVIG